MVVLKLEDIELLSFVASQKRNQRKTLFFWASVSSKPKLL